MYLCEIHQDELTSLFAYCQRHKIDLHHLKCVSSAYYQFTVSYKNYTYLKNNFKTFNTIKAIGLFQYLLLYIKNKYRLYGLVIGSCWFVFLNQLTYGCRIENTYPLLTDKMNDVIEKYRLNNVIFQVDDIEKFKEDIYENIKDEIDYFDLYQHGKIYYLSYTPRLKANLENTSSLPLVSFYDAIVDRIEVSSGNVLVKKNQYVTKGEILVSNEIIATNDEVKIVDVKGEIYGYVYHTFEARTSGELDVDTYLKLYQEISSLVSQEILSNGHIVNEYVLQYTKKEGKIILKIQYTLYQNIAQKGFLNE